MHSSPTHPPYTPFPESSIPSLHGDSGLLRSIVESCDDAIFSLSLEGFITSWNPAAARLYGYSRDEILGASPQILAPPELIAEVAGLVGRTLAGESIVDVETRRCSKDGRVLDVSVTNSPLRDQNGDIIGICAVHRDIRERKAAQRRMEELAADLEQRVDSHSSQLEIANRDLREYAHTIAHDLRTPLRAIAGFAAVLSDGYGDSLDSEALRMLDVIRSNTEDVGRRIDTLLSLARQENGPLNRRTVDMQAKVESCVAELAPEREGRTIEFMIGELPPCEGEAVLLRKVWMVLLSNAQKFTRSREQARIEIGSATENGQVCYFVRDNGVGFDMTNAERIFGIFQRAHRPEEYEGMGVGLAMAARIIERHRGRVWAQARPGDGTTVFFTVG